MAKKILKFLVSLSVGLVVFFIVVKRVGTETIKQAYQLVFGFEGGIILLLTGLIAYVCILRWKMVLKSQGTVFSLKTLSPLWFIGFSMSYLTPFSLFGGEIFRIYFAKKKLSSLSWRQSMSSVAIDKILDATLFFPFLITGLLIFAFYGRFPTSFLGISVIIIAGSLLGLLLLFYLKRAQKQSALEWLLKIFGIKREKLRNSRNGEYIFEAEQEVFRFFSLKKKGLWQGLSLSFLRYTLLFLRCVVLIFFLKGSVGVLKGLAVYSFANLAVLTPLPATLGALELSQGFAFAGLNLGFAQGASFSMVWRSADLVICFFGLIFLIKYGITAAEDKVLRFFERN